MQTHKSASGLELPVLGFGTWGIGGRARERDMDNDDARDVEAIRNAVQSGITHIDTAEIYAGGHSETLVGEAVKGMDRNAFTIASKVFPTHHRHDDVLKAFDGSTKRLGLDTLDLYYLHMANHDVPFEDTARALNKLLADGRIKHVGVCNFTTDSMDKLQKHLDAPIAANQSHYNLIFRAPERTNLLSHCRAKGCVFLAWRPILWRYPDRANPPAGNPWNRGTYPILDEAADRNGKTNTQIALNWLISQPGVSALVKTANPLHLKEIIGATGWSLPESDIMALRQDFPDQRDVSDAVPLG